MHMPRSKQRPGNQHLRDAEELPQDRHLSNLPKFSVRYLSKDVVYPLIPKMKVEFCYNCLNYISLFNASFFQWKKNLTNLTHPYDVIVFKYRSFIISIFLVSWFKMGNLWNQFLESIHGTTPTTKSNIKWVLA